MDSFEKEANKKRPTAAFVHTRMPIFLDTIPKVFFETIDGCCEGPDMIEIDMLIYRTKIRNLVC